MSHIHKEEGQTKVISKFKRNAKSGVVEQFCFYCNLFLGNLSIPARCVYGNGLCAPPTKIIQPSRPLIVKD